MNIDYVVDGRTEVLTLDYEYAITDEDIYAALWEQRMKKLVLFFIQAGLFSKLRFKKKFFKS